jgi:hypothetical protein
MPVYRAEAVMQPDRTALITELVCVLIAREMSHVAAVECMIEIAALCGGGYPAVHTWLKHRWPTA